MSTDEVFSALRDRVVVVSKFHSEVSKSERDNRESAVAVVAAASQKTEHIPELD